MIVPLLEASTDVPVPIVAPLSVSAPPLNTFTVMPGMMLLPTASKEAPGPSSSVTPDDGFMFAPATVPTNSKVPPLLTNSGLPPPSLLMAPLLSRMPKSTGRHRTAACGTACQDDAGHALREFEARDGAGAYLADAAAAIFRLTFWPSTPRNSKSAAAADRRRAADEAAGLGTTRPPKPTAIAPPLATANPLAMPPAETIAVPTDLQHQRRWRFLRWRDKQR